MPESYWMTGINLLLSLVLLSGVVIYTYVWPKRKINNILLLIIISILPTISIFRQGVYESGDLSVHTAYAMSFYSLLEKGDLTPIWTDGLNSGYGYPLFEFSYILPYYFSSIFHFFGLSFLNSVKTVLALSFIVSGITMYLYVKEESGKANLAFMGAIFYLFSPYHLIDLHFRVDIGEVLAFVFTPLVFFFAKKIESSNSFKWLVLESLSISALILSHQAISLSVLTFFIIYSVILLRKNRMLLVLSFILGLAISAFYWIPILVEKQYTHPSVNIFEFTPFNLVLFSPWKYGFLFQGPYGELSFPIGYAHIILIIFVLYLLLRKKVLKKERKKLITLLLFTTTIIFMTTPLSAPLWHSIPFIHNFQFSYRMMGAVILFASLCAVIALKHIHSKLLLSILCILAISTTILNWGNRKTIPDMSDTQIYNSINSSGIGLMPAMPKWLPDIKQNLPSTPLEGVNGLINIVEEKQEPTRQTYQLVTQKDTLVKANTAYFPGWIALVDQNPVEIHFQNPSTPGLITFIVPEGNHTIQLAFEDTVIRKLSNLISIGVVCVFTLISFIKIIPFSKGEYKD